MIKNTKAYFDYHVTETWEAGLKLRGYEARMLDDGAQLSGSFVTFISNSLVWNIEMKGDKWNEGRNSVSLLLKKSELSKIRSLLINGFTLIPLELYRKNQWKLKIGLAKSKNKTDKRQAIKERDAIKEINLIS